MPKRLDHIKLKDKKHIAILGGGPSGLFMYKRFVESERTDLVIDIFEKKRQLGIGMPYSVEGASDEHITNVSGNEIPELVTSIEEWIQTVPKEMLDRFAIDPRNFNDYKVLPRLLFGQYLSAQFDLLLQIAREKGILTNIHFESLVTDIIDDPKTEKVAVEIGGKTVLTYDHVVVCTGHNWPFKYEGLVPGYFDSPYPPSKLAMKLNHRVAIKGSSLTAIDAIRTLARNNGQFVRDEAGKLSFRLADECPEFKLLMHSRNGMLPAIRFHLEDSHLGKDSVMSPKEVEHNRSLNDGFLPLDLVFEKNFKEMIRDKDPEFYHRIQDMKIEEFVDLMMDLREHVEPFHLFRAEYIEAEKSIKRHESVYWKEMLAVLSFAMNYPAKYFSAEDMQRLQKVLMPLISIVIAFIPQSSVEEMMALHNAGVLEILSVGDDSKVEPDETRGAIYYYIDDHGKEQVSKFETFVDCVGQPHLSYDQLPYKGLLENKTVSRARLKFRDASVAAAQLAEGDKKVELDAAGNYYLQVAGITINDDFQVVDDYGTLNERIYMMAVPYIGGYNPDYSGLDFSEAASARIIKSILKDEQFSKLAS